MNGDVGHSEPGAPSLPRLIQLKRGSEGYGFNLHGEKGIHGQFISAVDEGSPAQLNDVRVGDRVIAVNGEDVEDLPHSKVVERIRAGNGKVSLLVVDEACDQYYRSLGVKVPQDKYETVAERSAVPDIVEDQVSNGGEQVQADNVEVVAPSEENTSSAVAENVADNTKGVEGAEENDAEDGGEYEEVIPQVSSKEPEEKPAETTEVVAPSVPDEAPAPVVVSKPEVIAAPEPEAPEQEAPEQTANVKSNIVEPSSRPSDAAPPVIDTSPQFDMASARPKPRRNEVKRATQNWKQKYDDFNKL